MRTLWVVMLLIFSVLRVNERFNAAEAADTRLSWAFRYLTQHVKCMCRTTYTRKEFRNQPDSDS